jgi:hypothetical protein
LETVTTKKGWASWNVFTGSCRINRHEQDFQGACVD